MNDDLDLVPGLHLAITSRGALHALTASNEGPAERLLRNLLRAPKSPTTDEADLRALADVDDEASALTTLALAQDAGWVEGRVDPPADFEGPLGQALPDLLAPLSDIGHAALVDDQGFSLGSVGFSPAAEEELSVLAAEVVRLRQRRATEEAAPRPAHGWALVDEHGASAVALYPLEVGPHTFVLIVGGLPRLNRADFALLTSALCRRYDPPADPPSGDPSASQPPQQGDTTHA